MAMKSASRKSKRQFHNALKKILPHLRTQIVKRSDQPKGFVVLPKRWIVERTLAWLNRCADSPRIGRTSIATRWRSCGLPQSASCSESFVIPPDVFGQTLKAFIIQCNSCHKYCEFDSRHFRKTFDHRRGCRCRHRDRSGRSTAKSRAGRTGETPRETPD
jgi:Transposase DDE domain